MDVVLLGTGSPIPDPSRAGPSTLVRASGRSLLVDCGRGVLMRLAGAGVLPMGLDAVLLTHLHSDHTTDLNDVITMWWAMQPSEVPLRIAGPVGTSAFVDATLAMLEVDIGYRLAHHDDLRWRPRIDVTELDDGSTFEAGGVRVSARLVDHGVVKPAIGLRIEADGASVVCAGDTVPCDGLDALCAGADVYVQTVLRRPLVEAVPSARFQDILTYHSSTEEAGRTAARAGAGTLVMTHQIPPPAPEADADWIGDAAAHFDGRIVFAEDLLTVTP